eukprot:scaffold175917_cov46-Tisochrysis_lutea.AAC.1
MLAVSELRLAADSVLESETSTTPDLRIAREPTCHPQKSSESSDESLSTPHSTSKRPTTVPKGAGKGPPTMLELAACRRLLMAAKRPGMR